MAKITSIEDCIVEYKGQRRCVYCGAVLPDGEVCNCTRFTNTCEKLAKAAQCADKVELWAAKEQQYLDAIYPPRYEFRMALVRVEEESTNDGTESGDGGGSDDGVDGGSGTGEGEGGEEPTEEGGE